MTMCDDEQIGRFAQVACLWEATARKPGNVHRFADFEDLTYLDFALSAGVIGAVLAAAPRQAVGQTVLEGIRRTRQVVRTNTNLGILLLLAPLARAAGEPDIEPGVEIVLAGLTVRDAELVYEAIRLAVPGGLGQAPAEDVRERPTRSLRAVMALAAEHDLIARQYANGFHEVFHLGLPALLHGLSEIGSLEGAILWLHLQLLAAHPDTLIRRKCGDVAAGEAQRQARHVLAEGWPSSSAGWTAFCELDRWLRAEGHRRNPGTTADLAAACLFVALVQGRIPLPCTLPWSIGPHVEGKLADIGAADRYP
jgi:triphosphoribosyl-dephospho-CoA synthase